MGGRVFAVIGVFALALGIGVATYFVARSGGPDIGVERARASAAGERAGAARGAADGYREGRRTSRKRAYRASYRRAYRAELRRLRAGSTAALSPPRQPVKRRCGDLATEGAGTYGIESENVECGIARATAGQWETECAQNESGDCTTSSGFACDYTQVGYELGRISCVSGDRRITFETGA